MSCLPDLQVSLPERRSGPARAGPGRGPVRRGTRGRFKKKRGFSWRTRAHGLYLSSELEEDVRWWRCREASAAHTRNHTQSHARTQTRASTYTQTHAKIFKGARECTRRCPLSNPLPSPLPPSLPSAVSLSPLWSRLAGGPVTQSLRPKSKEV